MRTTPHRSDAERRPEPLAVRPPAVAGMFYPESAAELRSEVHSLLAVAAATRLDGELVALVAPHAGYRYSGPTAAAAYRLLEGRSIRTAVIVSPSHREYFDGISVFDGDFYRTPLGDVAVDRELRAALLQANDPDVVASSQGHHGEHAVEVQLPFLQVVLGGSAAILPIVMGDQRRSLCVALAHHLARILRDTESILVASTDLSHYHPYDAAVALDSAVIRSIEQFDAERLLDDLAEERVEACGGGPTAAVLLAASLLGATRVEILHRCNSGDVTGDRRSVVGYCSAAITR